MMAKVRNLYDALIRPSKDEDKCTNYLVWLLSKLPPKYLNKLCQEVKLTFIASDYLHSVVQYVFCDSRPDAVFESNNKYLILETKIYSNKFDDEQFANHINGAYQLFKRENCWFLFLSTDEYQPEKISALRRKYSGHVSFISWKQLLHILSDSIETTSEQHSIIIRELLSLAKHYKLGRIEPMNTNELYQYIESYKKMANQRDSATLMLVRFMKEINKRMIANTEERAELYEDESEEALPCIFNTFTVNGWHTRESAYVFLNIFERKIGILLTGYQDNAKEKKILLDLWDSGFKQTFREDKELSAYTWIDERSDESIENCGHFKQVGGVTGCSFNPLKISEIQENFYWGYSYNFDAKRMEEYFESIPAAFSRLLDRFATKTSGAKACKKSRPNKSN